MSKKRKKLPTESEEVFDQIHLRFEDAWIVNASIRGHGKTGTKDRCVNCRAPWEGGTLEVRRESGRGGKR